MSRYLSTRGPGKPASFEDVLLAGLAPDGGLYIPENWPTLSQSEIGALAGAPYAALAEKIMQPFVGKDIEPETFSGIVRKTYEGGAFAHKAAAPLVQIGPDLWVLELFHGPTIAFKDYALQLLGRLFDHVLDKRKRRVTIVGATSGDTGSAAIEACKDCRHIDIFILHPEGRVSEVQRRQMTTVDSPNVHNIAVKGTFDDCQAMVKAMFGDEKFREDMRLSAVNSINWARIMAQIVYYFYAALALGAPNRPVSFSVPTGNFGNVYAAWAARRMGLPLHNLTVASNRNDILTRFFESGTMKTEGVAPTISPSMDIQISSNFERYLCEAMDRDFAALATLMQEFRETGAFSVPPQVMKRARGDFSAVRCSEDETIEAMRTCYQETGYILDPHTAVGLHGAKALRREPGIPVVVAATAHPAKFPDAVENAIGLRPALPPHMRELMEKPEKLIALPNDIETVKAHIRSKIPGAS